MLLKNEVILAEIESTYNTDPTPTGAEAVAFSDVSWSNEGLRMIERNLVKQGLDMEKRIYGGHLKTIVFTCELKGSGAAGTAPEFGPLLRSCGMDETIVVSTSVTYGPVSTALESCTIYYFEGDGTNGIRHILTGCRGTCVFNFQVGDVPKVTFTMTGHRSNPTDNAAPTPTYDSTDPVGLINIPFTVGGDSLVVNGFTLETTNEIATVESLSASDGYGDVRISSRDPGGSLDPETVLVATTPIIADLTGGQENAISIGSIGATAGNIVDLDLPAAYYVDAGPADREGIRTYDLPYKAAISAGDDEWSLVFT